MIITEVPPPVEPEVGKILVIVGAVTNMLLVTAWPEKLASTPPSAATTGEAKLIRIDYHGSREIPTGTCEAILKAAGLERKGK